MPSGYVAGLPGPAGGDPGAPQWGTVTPTGATGGSWNAATVSLSDPGENGFWAVTTSQASNGYTYLVGTSQAGSRSAVGGIECHNGSNGWTSTMLTLMQQRPGVSWPGSFNINMTGNYLSSSARAFTYTEGFQRIVYGGRYGQVTSSSSTGTITPFTNKGPYPGGIAIAGASHEAGYASGMTGISSASQDAGWVGGTYGGALSAIAFYILSTDEIETPPACTFTTVYSPNCWNVASMYIR